MLVGLLFLAGFTSVIGAVVLLREAGILALFVAVPLAVYVGIRVAFFELAIFDGAGVIEGLAESWRISARSVLRLIGWGLVFVAIAIAVGILDSIVSGSIERSSDVLAAASSALISGALACFSIYFLATLYESQRARLDPSYRPDPGAAPPAFDDPWSRPRE